MLRAIDLRLAELGSTKGSKSKADIIKSAVRVFVGTDDIALCQSLDTAYVADTCVICSDDAACVVLGGTAGQLGDITAAFDRKVAETSRLHEALHDVPDPATQLVLRGSCANVSKVTYLLRLFGDRLDNESLQSMSDAQRQGLAHTLQGDVGDLGWEQATIRVKQGGLGLHKAPDIALLAFVSSRTAARGGVAHLFQRLHQTGLATCDMLL